MFYLKLVVAVIFISFAVFACSSGNAKRKEFIIAESKSYEASIFRQNCAVCHGNEGNGKEVNGRLIPTLRYGTAATKSEEEIYNQISNGGNGMLPFKYQLSEKEIRQMTLFVRRDLQGKKE
jgi:cytochrome c553